MRSSFFQGKLLTFFIQSRQNSASIIQSHRLSVLSSKKIVKQCFQHNHCQQQRRHFILQSPPRSFDLSFTHQFSSKLPPYSSRRQFTSDTHQPKSSSPPVNEQPLHSQSEQTKESIPPFTQTIKNSESPISHTSTRTPPAAEFEYNAAKSTSTIPPSTALEPPPIKPASTPPASSQSTSSPTATLSQSQPPQTSATIPPLPPTTTPILASTLSTAPLSTTQPKQPLFERVSSIVLKTTSLAFLGFLVLHASGDHWQFTRYPRNLFRTHYIPLSPYKDLYTYSTEVIYRNELTFQLKPDDLQHNISVYQLLILKDVFALYLFLDDLLSQFARLNVRYPQLDEFSRQEMFTALKLLTTIRNHLHNLTIKSELDCLIDTDPEKLNYSNEEYISKFGPHLYTLERHWCETSAAKDFCEALLPLLEQYTSQLLVWNEKNKDRLRNPLFLQQLSSNSAALPPPAIVPEIPFHQWELLYSTFQANLKESTKIFVTKPTEETMRTPLSPKQEQLRSSLFRTSSKVTYNPLNDRRLEALFDQHHREAIAMEEAARPPFSQKPKAERLKHREKQIEERFHAIKRTERVKAAMDRVTSRVDTMKQKRIEADQKEMENMTEDLHQHLNIRADMFQKKLTGNLSFEDEVRELKDQMEVEELKSFDDRHPEVAHVTPTNSLYHPNSV